MSARRVISIGDCGRCGRKIERLADGWVDWTEEPPGNGRWSRATTSWRVVHRECSSDKEHDRGHHLDHFVGVLGLSRLAARIDGAWAGPAFSEVLVLVTRTIEAGYMATPPALAEVTLPKYEARYARWHAWLLENGG